MGEDIKINEVQQVIKFGTERTGFSGNSQTL